MKVIYNGLLGGWYIVRGAHHTPLGGRFDSREAALAIPRPATLPRLRGPAARREGAATAPASARHSCGACSRVSVEGVLTL
jgi:hypothetical protein